MHSHRIATLFLAVAACGAGTSPIESSTAEALTNGPSTIGDSCLADGDCMAAEFCSWQGCLPREDRKEGDPCQHDEQCYAGHCSELVCIGRPRKDGERCGRPADCASGSCNFDRCGAPLVPGARCYFGPTDSVTPICGPGYSCQVMGRTRTCQPLRRDGGSCDRNTDCASGTCIESSCTPDRTVGQSCHRDSDCVSGVCSMNWSNSPPRWDRAEGTCVDGPMPSGGPCDSHSDCLLGYCEHTTQPSWCRVLPSWIGAPCNNNSGCAPGLHCVARVCTDPNP